MLFTHALACSINAAVVGEKNCSFFHASAVLNSKGGERGMKRRFSYVQRKWIPITTPMSFIAITARLYSRFPVSVIFSRSLQPPNHCLCFFPQCLRHLRWAGGRLNPPVWRMPCLAKSESAFTNTPHVSICGIGIKSYLRMSIGSVIRPISRSPRSM